MSASPVGNYYLYGFDGSLLQLYDVYGQLLKDYIYMGSRLVAEYDHVGARYLYYTSDLINSTRMVTDGAGNVVYSVAHDPCGGIQKTWVTTYNPQLKFSGKERDTESELDYFGARYYDRSQYRFISVDQKINFADVQSDYKRMNLYAYCGNNPIVCVDPNGLSYLKYYHLLGQIYLYSSSDEVVGIFPAANDSGNNPFPHGTWGFDYFNGDYAEYWPGIDNMGIYVFRVPGHPGMGVHAHEEGYQNLAWLGLGGKTYSDPTGGCISTTHAAMEAIAELVETDPITKIVVERYVEAIIPETMTTGLPLVITVIVPTLLPPPGPDLSSLGPKK